MTDLLGAIKKQTHWNRGAVFSIGAVLIVNSFGLGIVHQTMPTPGLKLFGLTSFLVGLTLMLAGWLM